MRGPTGAIRLDDVEKCGAACEGGTNRFDSLFSLDRLTVVGVQCRAAKTFTVGLKVSFLRSVVKTILGTD